jgi:endonuclease-3
MEAATPPPAKKTKSSITTSANGTPLKKATPKKPATAITPTAELLQKAQRIAEQLNHLYPSPPIPLDHSSTFQLLVAVILSAQTTDKKVNEVRLVCSGSAGAWIVLFGWAACHCWPT